MSSSQLIGLWATGVWIDLGQPSNISSSTLSGYAIEPSTLGRLNSFIGTCFSGSGYAGPGTVNYDVVPDIGQEELSIVGTMYLVSYYNGLSNATMGFGGDSIPWTSIAEGDTKAARTNGAQIGGIYAKMAQDAQNQLKYLANVYINNTQGGNRPRDVEYYNIWPATWSSAFIGGS